MDEGGGPAEQAGYRGGEGPARGGGARRGASSWPRTQRRCASTPARSWAWTSGGTWCAGCGWSGPRTSRRSTTPPLPSTARPACTWGWSPPRGHRHRAGRRAESPEALARVHVDPVAGLSEAQARDLLQRSGLARRPATGRGGDPAPALPLLRGGGRHPGGDQPPDPDPGRAGARPGRQGQPGRQRAFRHPEGGLPGVQVLGPPGGAGPGEGAAVRGAAGERGHRGQRGRAGHEHPGRGQPGGGSRPTSWTGAGPAPR